METNNIILIIFLITIISKAVGDGLRQRDILNPTVKLGIVYHLYWVLSYSWLVLLIINIPIYDFGRYIIAFVLLRFGIFDLFRNIANNKKWYFIGDTAAIDKLANKIFSFNFGPEIYLGIKLSVAILSMWLIQYYEDYF